MFLVIQGGVFKVDGRMEIDMTESEISYKEKVFPVNSQIQPFEWNKKLYYFFNIQDRLHLSFEQLEMSYDERTRLMDLIVNDSIISQLIKSEEAKINWMNLIMGLVGGLGAGLTIGILL